jgi:hypothetical protein
MAITTAITTTVITTANVTTATTIVGGTAIGTATATIASRFAPRTDQQIAAYFDTVGGALPDLIRIVDGNPGRVLSIADRSGPQLGVRGNYDAGLPLRQ